MNRVVPKTGRRVALLSCLAVLALVPTVASPASALSSASCTLTFDLLLRPGLNALVPTEGSLISTESGGTINCEGVIDDGIVTGPGRVTIQGEYRGNCAQGFANGRAPFAIPTTRGVSTGTADFTVLWEGLTGQFTAAGRGYGYGVGPFVYRPTNGDCLTRPVTAIRFQGQQTVASI